MQDSISSSCCTVNLGSACAQQISASVQPSTGFTVWVGDVLLPSVEIQLGSVIRAGSFTFAGMLSNVAKSWWNF